MDKLDIAVLDFMNESRAVTKMSAISIKTIHTEINAKSDTLYRRLSGLVKSGHAEKGIKESRGNTYYITVKGRQTLQALEKELKEILLLYGDNQPNSENENQLNGENEN